MELYLYLAFLYVILRTNFGNSSFLLSTLYILKLHEQEEPFSKFKDEQKVQIGNKISAILPVHNLR